MLLSSPRLYQSPIALYTKGKEVEETYYKAKSILTTPTHKVRIYNFNEEKVEWVVLNDVVMRNNGLQFKLAMFHTHVVPGSHTLNGEKFDIELHFIFNDTLGKGVSLGLVFLGKQAKLASEDKKRRNNIWGRILANKSIDIGNITQTSDYLSYHGSRESGGNFAENIQWLVFTNIFPIDKSSYEKFVPMSRPSREIQPRNGRDIVLAE